VLSEGTTGEDLPIAYASRVLTTHERNYSTERELTAIIWACEQFSPEIVGRRLTTATDHKLLTLIFWMNDTNSRMSLKAKVEEI
jgi:hypothetical protein